MQISMFEAMITPTWKKFDTENKGYLTKQQIGQMVEDTMIAKGYGAYFNSMVFEGLFDRYDKNKTGQLSRREVAGLINYMVFRGL